MIQIIMRAHWGKNPHFIQKFKNGVIFALEPTVLLIKPVFRFLQQSAVVVVVSTGQPTGITPYLTKDVLHGFSLGQADSVLSNRHFLMMLPSPVLPSYSLHLPQRRHNSV